MSNDIYGAGPAEALVGRLTKVEFDALAKAINERRESGEFARDIEERLRPYRDSWRRYDPFLIVD